MVQLTYNEKPVPQRYARTPTVSSKTVIIVYDQLQVVVVRHYTKTIILQVDPNEYQKQFGRVLLDTSTLLALTRRLNIHENLIRPPKVQ